MHTFRGELKTHLSNTSNYSEFEETFLKILNKHAPVKKKTVRANDKPYRSYLKNKYIKYKAPDLQRAFKRQKNYKQTPEKGEKALF